MEQVKILNCVIDNMSQATLLEKLKFGGVVYLPNVDHVINLQKDREFYQSYQAANYIICDSQILMYAAKILGTPLVEKISGADLFPEYYQYHKDDPEVTIFLLGANDEICITAQNKINQKVGREMVVGYYCPDFGFEKSETESQKIIDLINQSGATVLAVGVSAPKREKWIFKYKNRFKNIKTFFAIGATINFESGHSKRAPKWMCNVGLEWLHRLLSEPKRLWRRYLVEDLPFFWLLLLQKLKLYKDPFVGDKTIQIVPSPSELYLVPGEKSKAKPVTLGGGK
ncbi:MAG: WecB/TagA/CpsF family glycosyltransferase [Oscillatoria sp. PMC 1051.18]|nr:WecB/TagA/CpsF family glycosyltransferase [Oscillatoria sp. PMC 1051.18]